MVVLPNFSKVIDKGLGVMNVTGAFFLKILDEDEHQRECVVNNVDSEVCEEDKYPEEYYVGVWEEEYEHVILVQRSNQQSRKGVEESVFTIQGLQGLLFNRPPA